MRKIFTLAAALLLCTASYAAVKDVSTFSQLYNAVAYSSDTIHLTTDIIFGDAEGSTLYVPAYKTCVIDMDQHELRRTVTNSANTIRPTITLGRGANLTLINGSVVCNNTHVDASIQPCAVYMPGDKSVLNLESTTLVAFINNNHAANAYGLMTDDQEDITINARFSNINCLYLKNLTHIHTLHLYRVYLGSDNRKSLGHIGLKADNGNHLQGTFAMGEVHGTNLSGAQLLSLIPDEDMKYFDWNNPSISTPLTRAQIAQMTNLQNQSLYFFPELNFSVSNTAVTYTNCDDILGDGRVRFDYLTNTLYLETKNASVLNTINGNIVFDDFKLNIVVDGKWKINGRIVGHDGDLIISPAHYALTEEDGDLLSLHSQNSTAVSLNGKSFCAKNRVRVVIDDNNTNTQTAVSCGMFVITNAWFDAWGKKPVVDCTSPMISKATIKTGSLNNDVIQIEPQFTQYYIFVQTNGDERGSVTGKGIYNEGTELTISATPKSGYYFDRWYEDGSTDATRTITVTKDATYTALFFPEEVINYYTIDIKTADVKMGLVSGPTGTFEEGTKLTFEAIPASGYQFLYWMDSHEQVVSGSAVLNWTVTADEILTAHFRVQPPADAYMLWVCGTQVTGSNSADILGDGVWCYDHETRTLSTMKMATYNIENHGFIEDWVTDAGSLTVVFNHLIDATCTTTDNVIRTAIVSTKGMTFTGSAYNGPSVTAKNMYVANFSDVFTITGHITAWLYLQNTTDFGRNYFTTAILLAGKTPSLVVNGANLEVLSGVGESTGYKVSNKTDQAANLSLINAVVDDGSISAKSLYISDNSPKYEINYLTPSIESLCAVGGFNNYFEGTHITLRAYPAPGYKFVSWSDGNTDNPRLIIMPAHNLYLDPIVEVEDMSKPGAIISASATEGQGSITGFTSGWYAEGTELTITAEPAEGYEFVEWSDGNTANPRYITVENGKNVSITAIFLDKAQGIEDILVDGDQPQKILHEGQIYIFRGGKIYTVQGAQMK